ncbi:uncharacterized protein [Nicotiana tomentosiformis]|uniref:uncharacterized protein n=1 Tax=Nicotiana tomentosiformis TaxID=4098 RepID=UPI00388CDDFF
MRMQYSDNLLLLEKTIIQNLEKWSLIEKSVLKHMARVKWIKLGDVNTNIKEEIVKFYKSLMGTVAASLPDINKETIENGPKLTHEQQLSLCVEVTEEVIYAVLCAIHEDKAPRVDGYNSCFFKRACPLIKSDVVRAIKDFFTTGK